MVRVPRKIAKYIDRYVSGVSLGDTEHNSVNANDVNAGSVNTTENNIGRTKHLSDGSDLGALIDSAVGNGYESIYVHERDGGGGWTWDTDISFDFAALGHGVTIIVEPTVEIEYTGDSTALTISNGWSVTNTDKRLTLIGGDWNSSGEPNALVQADDCYGTWFAPTQLSMSNSNNDAEAIRIRNVNSYSEECVIGGYGRTRIQTDRGVTFVDVDSTGGSGTNSFQASTMRDVNFSCSDYCVKTAGIYEYCGFESVTFQVNEDNGVGVLLDSERTRGTGFVNCKWEAPPDPAGAIAFDTGPDYDGFYNPASYSGFVGFGIGEGNAFIPNFFSYNYGLQLNYIGSSTGYNFRENEFVIKSGDGNATLSVGGDGVLEVNDENGTRDL